MPAHAITQSGYPDAAVEAVLDALPMRRSACLLGVSGLQGSGKSTLSAQLVAGAARRGIAALSMSIDDFYFGRAYRQRLARSVHPLLATRGVPGTHDVDLLQQTLTALAAAGIAQPARVPVFDKGRDTRLPPSRWHRSVQAPRLIVLEGWCIGVPPQTQAQLRTPINALESDDDADARWRRFVNAQLAERYVALWRRLDRLMLLQAPSYDVVARWRDEQEQALRDRGAPRAMSPQALRRFLMHYERLSRHALKTLPARADLRLVLDENRHVRRVVHRPRDATSAGARLITPG